MAVTFNALGIDESIEKKLIDLSIRTPTAVQEQAIPLLLAGHDVIAQAQTGTGKTAAFALPILQNLKRAITKPQALVLAPTRELALQVAKSIFEFSPSSKQLSVISLVGGSGYREQLQALKSVSKNQMQIVVGTPGRVMDHMRRGSLDLTQIHTFVLDEADEMLRMGFIEDVEWILEHIPDKRQMALFSATMPSRIRQIANRYLIEAQQVTVKAKTATVASIHQRFLFASNHQKQDALLRVLETESYTAAIIFARTKQLTEEIAVFLQSHAYKAKAINGDIPQVKRVQTVDELKQGKIDVLVATDVAARGLDIERISLVINYDLPFDTETYVHRIGRTGRAGREGHAIAFITPKESRQLNLLERKTKQKITKMTLPSDEEIEHLRNQRFLAKLHKLMQTDLQKQRQLILDFVKEEQLDVLDIAAGLVKLQQKPLQSTKTKSLNKKDKINSSRKSKKTSMESSSNELYRLEVGKRDGAQARNIVGAIANEAGLDSHYIVELSIKDNYSTVRLPQGMPKTVFKDLGKAWVCGKQLKLKKVSN